MSSEKLVDERVRALGDSNSVYYRTVCALMREGVVAQQRADAAKVKVVLPVQVSRAEAAELSRKFSWNLEVKDYGIRARLPKYVAALSYLMGLRNVLLSDSDGQELLHLDGDLPALVAKGMSHGHVCRTYASSRLTASYEYEEVQLERLVGSKKLDVSSAASLVLENIRGGGGPRVCVNAASCDRRADVILVNHVFTPVSLAQIVATAKAHGARVVRGVCFFQPDMLYETSGELQAFDGRFYVDRDEDIISYVPRMDPGGGFSHPYSSLVSFFLNHEYCSGDERWLVEKHLSGDGIFHYVASLEIQHEAFPEQLTANYYRADMVRWVELSYMSLYDGSGLVTRGRRRVRVALLESVYEKVMSVLMCIDVKRLSHDEVFSLLRTFNNMAVCAGVSVVKPKRVFFDDLEKAVVPLMALAMVKRHAVSVALRQGLDSIKTAVGLQDVGAAALLWSVLCDKATQLRNGALAVLSSVDVASMCVMEFGDLSEDISVERVKDHVTVTHMSRENHSGFSYGRFESWLPGHEVRQWGLLTRAAARLGSMAWANTSVSSASSAAGNSVDDEVYVDAVESVSGLVVEEECVVTPRPRVDLSGDRLRLLDHLMAQTDAASVAPPPRVVHRYEGPTRVDVAPLRVLETDPVPVAQAEYDELRPGVSLSDEEQKPYVAALSDLERNIEMTGSVNTAYCEQPKARTVRRSRLRTGGGGAIPQSQSMTLAAAWKRNTVIPANRGHVDLDVVSHKIVDAIINTCYVSDWEGILAQELENGLWTSQQCDYEEYIPKLDSQRVERLMQEFVTCADEDLSKWVLMVKGVAKPPMDPHADEKVQLPQTILYSDQKTTNAKYSSMVTRFFHVMKGLLRPNISFNNRDSPADHEVWFNSCAGLRASAEKVWRFEGDIFCYDRSQEHMAQAFEFAFYRRHGLNEATLHKWSEIHGVKRASSMMFKVVLQLWSEGISGIFNTLFRNGLVCLGAVVYSASLEPQDIITLDVVGDDFLLESSRPVAVGRVVDKFALTFNLTAKLFESDMMYMCSKYWIDVNGWWYYVQDPMRKIESVSCAVAASEKLDDRLVEKWISLRDDLRHYDDALVMERLGEAVQIRNGFRFPPRGIIRALATWAWKKEIYLALFGPEEILGF